MANTNRPCDLSFFVTISNSSRLYWMDNVLTYFNFVVILNLDITMTYRFHRLTWWSNLWISFTARITSKCGIIFNFLIFFFFFLHPRKWTRIRNKEEREINLHIAANSSRYKLYVYSLGKFKSYQSSLNILSSWSFKSPFLRFLFFLDRIFLFQR